MCDHTMALQRQFGCRFETFSLPDNKGKTAIQRAVPNATIPFIIFLSIFFVLFLFDFAFRGFNGVAQELRFDAVAIAI
jgi:hypothetical protein